MNKFLNVCDDSAPEMADCNELFLALMLKCSN